MRFTVLLLLLTACSGPSIDNAPRAGDTQQLPPIEWRVVDRAELERAYRAAGMQIPERSELRGFAARLGDGRTVVYTLPPRHVDDDVTTTLGHEVMHVALGEYHR